MCAGCSGPRGVCSASCSGSSVTGFVELVGCPCLDSGSPDEPVAPPNPLWGSPTRVLRSEMPALSRALLSKSEAEYSAPKPGVRAKALDGQSNSAANCSLTLARLLPSSDAADGWRKRSGRN